MEACHMERPKEPTNIDNAKPAEMDREGRQLQILPVATYVYAGGFGAAWYRHPIWPKVYDGQDWYMVT